MPAAGGAAQSLAFIFVSGLRVAAVVELDDVQPAGATVWAGVGLGVPGGRFAGHSGQCESDGANQHERGVGQAIHVSILQSLDPLLRYGSVAGREEHEIDGFLALEPVDAGAQRDLDFLGP